MMRLRVRMGKGKGKVAFGDERFYVVNTQELQNSYMDDH
jgi:hypothetical protein